MARAKTLVQLRDRTRELSDQQESTFVAGTQLDVMINQGVAKAWKQMCRIAPARFRKTKVETTADGTLVYTLPDDFMSLVGVDYIYAVGPPRRFHSLLPYNFAERESYQYAGLESPWYSNLRYEAVKGYTDGADESLLFSANPGGNIYDIHYCQAPQLLVDDDDKFDGIAGYEDIACYESVVAILNKEESDPSAALIQLKAEYDDIRATMAIARDDGIPRQITNMKRRGANWPLN